MKTLELNDADRIQLEVLAHNTRDARTLRHSLTILWAASGTDAGEISKLLKVTRRDVNLWLDRIRAEGIPVLLGKAQDPGGRPTMVSEETEEIIQALMSHRPDQLGYSQPNWTVPLLRTHLARWIGEVFPAVTLRRHLHQLGYVWKRPRYVLNPDPHKYQIMAEIREKVASAKPHTAILCEDETDLLLFPPVRSTWAKRGQVIPVPIHGRNEKRVVFDAINIRTGRLLLLPRPRHRAEDFQFFLKLIRWHYRRWPVMVVLDLDHSHIARTSQILARALDIDLVWLPKRTPELNPIESLWGKAKDVVCANRQYDELDDQVDQFITYLQDLSTSEALRKSGVLSGSFWLWKMGTRF